MFPIHRIPILPLLFFVSISASQRFTALEIDNHPCKPENLKHSNRYICDSDGKVTCLSGWEEPEIKDPIHELNPCLVPVCNPTCRHGECRAPNYCACEVGWEGSGCDKCIPLPGCVHGNCSNAFECNCQPGWEGAYCDIASCTGCQNGDCLAPGECVCHNGWSGAECSVCEPLNGCAHGHCTDHPHTCICDEGWEGLLCDKPKCSKPCQHGFCHATTFPNGTVENICICHSGWRGDTCSKCSPYWACPNFGDDACVDPNQCFCFKGEADPEQLCNNTILNGSPNSRNDVVAAEHPIVISRNKPVTRANQPPPASKLPLASLRTGKHEGSDVAADFELVQIDDDTKAY